MVTAILGTCSAIVFGAADFCGGVAARRIPAVLATAIAALVGVVCMAGAALAVTGAWSPAALGWGLASGVCAAGAIILLYASLAIGPMSILSPTAAIVSALIPTVWGLGHGEHFTAFGVVGLALVAVAVVLVGLAPGQGRVRPSLRGLAAAAGSGLLIGVYMVMLDAAPHDSGLIPVFMNRVGDAALLAAVLAVLILRGRGRMRGLPRAALLAAALAGALDAGGNTLLLLGMRTGDLSLMAVLAALYPASTVVLAAALLRERVAPVQWVGLGLALSGAALLAA